MSTLKADTIQSTGGGAATLTKQQATKAFFNINASTPAIIDSLNASSLTDNATGKFTGVLTSAMSSTTYGGTNGATGADTSANSTAVTALFQTTRTASQFSITIARFGGSAASYSDATHSSSVLNGDLA